MNCVWSLWDCNEILRNYGTYQWNCDVWGAVMAKGKLEVEETKGGRTQIWFAHFAQKNSITNLIIRNYWVVEKFWNFYCSLSRSMGNFWLNFMNFGVVLYKLWIFKVNCPVFGRNSGTLLSSGNSRIGKKSWNFFCRCSQEFWSA